MSKKIVSQGLVTLSLLALMSFAQANPTLKHKGLPCESCHTTANAVAGNAMVLPASKTCMDCHGSVEALAKKTAPKDPHDPNPHMSHHYGPNAACTSCHAEHTPSKVMCNSCHDFKFKPLK